MPAHLQKLLRPTFLTVESRRGWRLAWSLASLAAVGAAFGLTLASRAGNDAPAPRPGVIPDGFFDFHEGDGARLTANELSSYMSKRGVRGEAAYRPWAGSWHPLHDNHIVSGMIEDHSTELTSFDADYRLSPLHKYALYARRAEPETSYTPKQVVAWERDHHTFETARRNARPFLSFLDWQGHCDGLAAASILYPEPVRKVMKNGIWFTPGDLKALLVESAIQVDEQFFGNRTKGRRLLPSAGLHGPKHLRAGLLKARRQAQDRADALDKDLTPADFHGILVHFLGKARYPIAADFNADRKVHNHPIFAFRSKARPVLGAPRTYEFTTSVAFTPYGEESSARAKPEWKTYTYELTADAAGVARGGRWTGRSYDDHPDFVWVPYSDTDADLSMETAHETDGDGELAKSECPNPVECQNPFIETRHLLALLNGATRETADRAELTLDPAVVKLFDWSATPPAFDDADELK